MNIVEHIEASHYPRDAKGRALVPMGGDRLATIYCVDHPCAAGFPVIGRDPAGNLRAWSAP